MPGVHINGHSRVCGATTVVSGQENVWANDELWAVEGDANSHGGGTLVSGTTNVFINGKPVINNTPDEATADALRPLPPHCAPSTSEGSDNVFVGDEAGAGSAGSDSNFHMSSPSTGSAGSNTDFSGASNTTGNVMTFGAGTVWKPISHNDGKLVILLPSGNAQATVTVDGETATFVGFTNGSRGTYRLSKAGAEYGTATLVVTGAGGAGTITNINGAVRQD